MSQASRSRSELHVCLSSSKLRVSLFKGNSASEKLEDSWEISELDALGRVQALACAFNEAAKQFEWISSSKGAIRVSVSEAWLKAIAIPWSLALSSSDSGDEYVRQMFARSGFVLDQDDEWSLLVSAWGRGGLAVSFPSHLLNGIKALSEKTGWAVAAVNSRLSDAYTCIPLPIQKPAAIVLIEETSFSIGLIGDSGLLDGVSRRFDHRTALNELPDQIQNTLIRQRLRSGQWRAMRSLHVVSTVGIPFEISPYVKLWFDQDGASQATFVHHIKPLNLLQGKLRPSVYKPEIVKTGLRKRVAQTQLALAVLLLVGALASTGALLTKRAASGNTARPLTSDVQNPSQVGREQSAAVTRRMKAVNSSIRYLNKPIPVLLQTLQPPKDIEVSMLLLTVEPGEGGGVVRFTCVAQSAYDMVRYVDLIDQRRPYVSAQIVSHELTAIPGEPARLKFSVEAAWKDL